jgi:glycine/D-amino acid oxidase-like deaminating enzyme
MTKYGRSPWIDRLPRSRVPAYPTLKKGAHEIEVVVIGGGLTGCATAYAFAAAGSQVALLEAGQIGRGASAMSSGIIADDPGSSFAVAAEQLGLRAARHAWRAWRRAALDFAALLRRLDVRCNLEPKATLVVAAGGEQSIGLRKEQKARKSAGLDAPSITAQAIAADAALTAAAGVRSRDSATLDPYRAAVGLAAAAAARGAMIYEGTPVRRTTFTRRTADVVTAGGVIRTRRIIVATGVPTELFKPLIRHFWFHSAFNALTQPLPAKLRRLLGKPSVIIRDAAAPPHFVRWVDAERLLITGADTDPVPPRLGDKTVVQRTGQLMYELSTLYPEISGIMPEYGWPAPYARTAEGVPYIGPHRNYPFHLFAFGDASHSVTGAYLASRILLRHHRGETDSADEAFGFTR